MTENQKVAVELPLDDPQLLPYLPMLYVAWADGELDEAEIDDICQRFTSGEEPDGGCHAALGRWLDTRRPPTALDLRRMLTIIRRGARSLELPERLDLSSLGLALARSKGRDIAATERQALVELAGALGIASGEAARQLVFWQRPEAAAEPPPAFETAVLTRLLDGAHHQLKQRVRAVLAEPAFAYRYGLGKREYREQVLDWCKVLADRGLGSLSYPVSCGGEADRGASVAVFEALGHGDLSMLIKFGVQFGLFGGSILNLGSETHHRRYLGAIGRLELPGCFAMTETGHGSNVYDIETTLTFDHASGELVVHTPSRSASKDYIGNAAAHGRLATVFAQLEIDGESYGVHAVLVPIREPDGTPAAGVKIEDCGEKLGLNGVDNGRLSFDQVRVPRQNLLDRFAQIDAKGGYTSPIASPSKRFFTMLGTLVAGRVSVAKAGLSAAKSALTIALRYAAQRRQFGPPGEPEIRLLDYLSHQRRLLPRLAEGYALHFALEHLAARFSADSGEDGRQIETLAAGLKALATRHATDTIQACREACGGKGYLAENRFAALKADADIFTTFEGDNTVLLQLVVKSLLSGFKRQFNNMNLAGLVRYVASAAMTQLAELNPAVVRRAAEEHLRDREFHLAAFTWRERHLLQGLAKRLKKRIDAGMATSQALIECQDHALATAHAHVESLVIEQFAAAIAPIEDEELRPVLERLADLYALSRLEADRGYFLETGYFEGVKAKAIRAQVNKLCGELRPHALGLVDAFAIPDQALAAPIAFGRQ